MKLITETSYRNYKNLLWERETFEVIRQYSWHLELEESMRLYLMLECLLYDLYMHSIPFSSSFYIGIIKFHCAISEGAASLFNSYWLALIFRELVIILLKKSHACRWYTIASIFRVVVGQRKILSHRLLHLIFIPRYNIPGLYWIERHVSGKVANYWEIFAAQWIWF